MAEEAFEAPAGATAAPLADTAVDEVIPSNMDMFLTGPGSRICKAHAYHDKLMSTAQKLSEVGWCKT